MKKQFAAAMTMILAMNVLLAGCNGTAGAPDSGAPVQDTRVSSSQTDGRSGEEEDADPLRSNATELTVRFGDNSEAFVMHLEDNSTAAAIAGYVGTTDWRLPVYSYDESDAMEYYDIPSRYEIPDNSETVTQAHAGDVYYSDPNRIVLYYRDAQINEEYTLIGRFSATDAFVDAVVNNPVLEGWGNQIVFISDGE